MIIEVTGPSGSGKSYYIEQILLKLNEEGVRTGAIHSLELNKSSNIPKAFSELESQNFMTDILALPWSIIFAVRNFKFFIFVLRCVFNLSESFFWKISILRSFVRKSGIRYFLSRKKYSDVLIIVDEGLFHSAHNFLCSPTFFASDEKIKKFFDLCPKPDKLILLNADKEILLDRLNKRKHISPRVSDSVSLEGFVENSFMLFTKFKSLIIANNAGIVLKTNNCLVSNAIKVIMNYINRDNLRN